MAIQYARGLAAFAGQPYEDVVARLREELPYVWLEHYQAMCTGPTNVLVVNAPGFDYLFDHCSQLPDGAREDRLVVAFGVSRLPLTARRASRIRGFPGSDHRGDRGHFLARAAGGGEDINLFHQNARLNRGHSPDGRRYRAMERYCEEHLGTFFFSRPIYADGTARPSGLEFGVLRQEVEFWVEAFANV
ncbi:MAG TPA: hypothetical protein VGR02_09085 [Thermoanaerobaculia bacterium]|jgi:hypothetical protein|nr:hypothetical protein [Thermoanaerobaculia bacterium]